MTVIGVTGPTGSGKSLLCQYFADSGIPVIDADEVYHGLLVPPSPCLDALRHAFGEEIFLDDGSLYRPALSEIVFHDEAKLSLLNRTVLGFVLEAIRKTIGEWEQRGKTHVIVDAPTLIESGFHRECHTVISVISPPELRVKRIMERDHISEDKALARIHAQKDDSFYRDHSQHVLINSENTEDFLAKAQALAMTLHLPLSPKAN